MVGNLGQIWWLDMGVDELFFAVEYDGEQFHGESDEEHDQFRRSWIQENTPWMVRVVRRRNIFGPAQDFHALLREWICEARRTLPNRMARGRWYDEVGD